MVKVRNIQPKSLIQQRDYPGVKDNRFDKILHYEDRIMRIPFLVFWIIAMGISWIVSGFEIHEMLLLIAFFVADYVLLFGLPIFKISFGPVKTVWFMLALLRSFFWLIPAPINLWFEILGTALILYGFYYEPQRLKLSRYTLESLKLPLGTKLKVLHLGDLHMERLTRREERILAHIEQEQPELILFSGDFLNLSYLHDPTAIADLRIFLNSLHAPLGVYGVTGSPAVDLPELFPELIQDTGLTLLNNQEIEIDTGNGKISLTGLFCTHNPDKDFAQLQAFHSPSNLFSILLYHTPDIAPLAQDAGFDLQLSGHTHGGQIRLPGFGALYTASFYGKLLEGGLYRLKQMTLFVTRGIGLEGASAPRVRLFCPPEIAIFTLQS